jgi:hypothetical protein
MTLRKKFNEANDSMMMVDLTNNGVNLTQGTTVSLVDGRGPQGVTGGWNMPSPAPGAIALTSINLDVDVADDFLVGLTLTDADLPDAMFEFRFATSIGGNADRRFTVTRADDTPLGEWEDGFTCTPGDYSFKVTGTQAGSFKYTVNVYSGNRLVLTAENDVIVA